MLEVGVLIKGSGGDAGLCGVVGELLGDLLSVDDADVGFVAVFVVDVVVFSVGCVIGGCL